MAHGDESLAHVSQNASLKLVPQPIAMEQPPPGSLDDLQPQDLSTCSSIPAVISVTGQSEECVLDASSMEALQMVRSANWYPHSGNSITGLPFLEAAPPDGRLLQPGDRIQPDNAFSNTTLTLSYVSRSHLFSTHDSLAQHSGLYGVPAIGKFSLPPSFESEKGLGEAGCALSQHYLEQNDSPLDLATQTELFQCFSQAQEGIENAVGVCLTQQSHEFNGAVVSIDSSQDKCLQSRTEHGAVQDTVNSCGVENFQSDSWSDSGACIQPLPNSLAANMGEPTVVFLLSGTPGPVVIPDGVHTRELCSLSGNYVSPLEDPVSPSATSLDGVEPVFSLPEASSSPSAENSRVENSCVETPKEPVCWDQINGGEPAAQPAALVGVGSGGDTAVTTDASNRYKSAGSRRKAVLEPLIDLTEDDDFLSEVMEENAKTSTLPHLNGKAPALQKSFQKKELPMRSGRGMRLEAIVMNINASRHKPLTCINTAKKPKASPNTASISKVVTVSPKKDSSKKKASVKAPISAKRTKLKAATAQRRRRPNGINTDSCKQSTSECETSNDSKTSHSSTPPKKPSPRVDVHKKAKNKQGDVSQQPIQSPEHSPYFHVHNGSKSKANHGLIAEPPLKSSPQLSKCKKPPRQRKRAACHVPTAEIDAVVKISSPPAKSPKKSHAKQTTHDLILEPPLKSSPQPSKQKKPSRQRKRASRHAPTAEIDAAERMSSPLPKSPKKSPAKQTNHGSIADPQLNSSPQFSKRKKSQRQPKHASRHSPTVEINAVRTSPSPAKSPKKSPAKQANCGSIPEPLLKSSPQLSKHKKSPKQPKHASRSATEEIDTVRMSSPQAKSPKKSPTKHKKGSRTPPASQKAKKVSHTPKKKKKKRQKFSPTMQSSMFSPREPEIKLRYVNYKEEKRDRRLDSFSPFIRREAKLSSPALCTVINYPEQEQSRPKKGQGRSGGGFMSGAVPSTSCLQLGRASAHSQHRRSLVCCLCGESANAMDLGDLHGPYYPDGYQPGTKTTESTAPGLKDDEDFSDSDSSLCSERGRNRANPLIPWQRKPKGHLLKRKGPSLGSQWWAGDGERCGSPAAKRARVDTDPTEAEEEDWYSPPVVALEPCEYWFHEDCGIWSAGVFLVKGKVYGLEEAVTVAQETMCSGCHGSGATLGCFFKGCPSKYHYRCALESGCVLTEDNFSMKCKKHKYKTLKAPPGTRRNDR